MIGLFLVEWYGCFGDGVVCFLYLGEFYVGFFVMFVYVVVVEIDGIVDNFDYDYFVCY